MNCHDLEENLPLLLYGDLTGWEQAACEEHLAEAAHCRAAKEEREHLHAALAERPQVEPSAALLAEARTALDKALDKEQHGWRALLHRGFPILRLQPTSGFAAALTLLLCGFGLGWGLRPH